MKKHQNILTLFLIYFSFSFIFSSCNGRDDEDVLLPPALDGEYGAQDFPRLNGDVSADSIPEEITKLISNMVRIEGKTFTIGDGLYAKPTHKVTLDSYWICKYEVTQGLWKAVMGTNPSHFIAPLPGFGEDTRDYPVESVSWDMIVNEFLPKLNEMTGIEFRLPTEAEWEFAARGMSKGQYIRFSGTGSDFSVNKYGWIHDYSCLRTHKVGLKKPNGFGLYDMTGNVWEWCSDWYQKYTKNSQTNPKGPDEGTYRILRGNSWISCVDDCSNSVRYYDYPSCMSHTYGFRLAY